MRSRCWPGRMRNPGHMSLHPRNLERLTSLLEVARLVVGLNLPSDAEGCDWYGLLRSPCAPRMLPRLRTFTRSLLLCEGLRIVVLRPAPYGPLLIELIDWRLSIDDKLVGRRILSDRTWL